MYSHVHNVTLIEIFIRNPIFYFGETASEKAVCITKVFLLGGVRIKKVLLHF